MNFLRYTGLAWAWTILVLVLCLVPGDQLPKDPIVNADKLYHTACFGLMAFLFVWGFRKQSDSFVLHKHALFFSLFISTSLGGLVEILQHYFVKNRQGDWFDFLFDTVGVLAALLAYLVLFQRKSNT